MVQILALSIQNISSDVLDRIQYSTRMAMNQKGSKIISFWGHSSKNDQVDVNRSLTIENEFWFLVFWLIQIDRQRKTILTTNQWSNVSPWWYGCWEEVNAFFCPKVLFSSPTEPYLGTYPVLQVQYCEMWVLKLIACAQKLSLFKFGSSYYIFMSLNLLDRAWLSTLTWYC